MKYEYWKYLAAISIILGILGILLLHGGIIAYGYRERGFSFDHVRNNYPYRDYAIPLIILGVVLLVIGITTFIRAQKKIEK